MIAAICNALAEPVRPAKRLERFSLENIAREYAALYMQLREDAFDTVKR
jgi:glycogen synthase